MDVFGESFLVFCLVFRNIRFVCFVFVTTTHKKLSAFDIRKILHEAVSAMDLEVKEFPCALNVKRPAENPRYHTKYRGM